MIIGRILAGGALAALLAAGALSAEAQARRPARAPESVRQAVIAELNEVRGQFMQGDDPRMQRPPVPDRMLTPIDINGDGLTDWRADYEHSEWAGGWCGTGGCRQQLWVSRRGGAPMLAFDDQAFSFAFRRIGGERRMEVAVHGTHCNGAGSDDCRYAYVWDPAASALRERVNFTGGGRLWEGGLDFLPVARVPAEVETSRAQLDCRDTPDAPARARETVDLNGDGVRDWIVGGPYGCGDQPGQTRILTSRGGGWDTAWTGRDSVLYVDIAGARAAVHVRPLDGCPAGGTPACEMALRWDAAARRFSEAR